MQETNVRLWMLQPNNVDKVRFFYFAIDTIFTNFEQRSSMYFKQSYPNANAMQTRRLSMANPVCPSVA